MFEREVFYCIPVILWSWYRPWSACLYIDKRLEMFSSYVNIAKVWIFLTSIVSETKFWILILFIIYFQFHILFFLWKVCWQYHTILPGNIYCPQADVTTLDERRIDCDITIIYVYFDVAFNLMSNYYVNYFLKSLCFYSCGRQNQ
jgi:hypothetical protein